MVKMMSTKISKLKTTKYYGVSLLLLIALIVWLFFKILAPNNFGTATLMAGYLQTSIQYAVGACGFYFIVVMGLFDFSVGANVVLSALAGVIFSRFWGLPGLILGCLVCGAIIGLFNGGLYTLLKIPSMIVTVGLMLILESVANYVISIDPSMAPGKLPTELLVLNRAPWNYVVAVSAFILMAFILHYTKIGTYINAIGSNETVANMMGINVRKYKFLGFIFLHLFVGIMALLTVSYGSGMLAVTGMATMERNFKPLMGTFFGVAFKKYNVPVIAIIIGEFIVTMIFNGLVSLNIPTTINSFATGAILLAIVTLTNRGKQGAVVK